ncbi:hypothetical protein C8F04DRAFT_1233342 [Mycena alexandri]|uniref:DUF6534 domain-containing protein n=1 Tax=Mycena alexandri TaxID=1745969 RepID=A0AAD6SYH9_9AGAR|nr:hypothetical protein C8F04DRAFT_1233342 [Mycena alexandri]
MAVSDPGINLILGPVILGIIINTFIFGIVFMQAITYYTSPRYKQDRLIIKGLVGWSLLLDIFHSSAVIWVIWEYCINHFGDTAFLGTTPWPYPTTPIFSSSASVPIQIFLAWRVKRLSKSWHIFGVLTALSVASGIMAWRTLTSIGDTCGASFQVGGSCTISGSLTYLFQFSIKDFAALIPVVDAWCCCCSYTSAEIEPDLQVCALALRYDIRRVNTWRRVGTDNIITRLTVQSIETASLSTFNSIMDLICFTALQNTNFHFVFALMAGRMYTNTLLATLNSREKLSEDMDGINTLTSPPLSRGVAVHVSVEQRQERGTELESYSKGISPMSSKGRDLEGNTYYV